MLCTKGTGSGSSTQFTDSASHKADLGVCARNSHHWKLFTTLELLQDAAQTPHSQGASGRSWSLNFSELTLCILQAPTSPLGWHKHT